MRREFLIIRHPKPKLSDDWFMLDRWTPSVTHPVVSRYREVVAHGVVVERLYRVCCACGWRSPEYHHRPSVEPCPVGLALQERAATLQRDNVRWVDTPSE